MDPFALIILVSNILHGVVAAVPKNRIESHSPLQGDGDCAFRVNGDLNDPVPLFVQHNTFVWITPDPDGIVRISSGQQIDMYCNSQFDAAFDRVTKLTAECLGDQNFSVNGLVVPFVDFQCTDWPLYTARRTGRQCNGGTDLLEVGFIVADGDGFLQTMEICHDEGSQVTRYVHHALCPSSGAYQRSVARPKFITGDFYENKNVDRIYTKFQQNMTISDILRMDASPYFNDSKSIFLARGHMAAKADYIFGAQQRSTFFFVNVAPQWQAFNAGNWERIEDGVRNYVSRLGLTADCYTGTWGILTLPDVNGDHQRLYLDFDENNNGLIPVPKLYFRIVIDRSSRKGIVLIGVNNPHATIEEIREDYIICPDIADLIDWINWSKKDLLKGYSYACSVPDFVAVVDHLPLNELHTTGILGIPDDIYPVAPNKFIFL